MAVRLGTPLDAEVYRAIAVVKGVERFGAWGFKGLRSRRVEGLGLASLEPPWMSPTHKEP